MLVNVYGVYFDINHLIEKSIETALMHTIKEVEYVWPEKKESKDLRRAAINILTAYMESLK